MGAGVVLVEMEDVLYIDSTAMGSMITGGNTGN